MRLARISAVLAAVLFLGGTVTAQAEASPAPSPASAVHAAAKAAPPPMPQRDTVPVSAPGPIRRDTCQSLGALRAQAERAGAKVVSCTRPGRADAAGTAAARRALVSLSQPARHTVGTVAPQPVPRWCADHLDGQWWFMRRDACAATSGRVDVRNAQTGAWLGSVDYFTIEYAYALPGSGLRSVYQVSVTPWRYEGTGWAGMTVLETGSCRSNCTLAASPPVRHTLVKDVIITEEFAMDATTSAPGARGDVWANVNLAFDVPGPDVHGVRDVQSLPIRCDNALPGNNTAKGCVFAGYWPTFALHYNDPNLGWNAMNVGWAIYTGLPSTLTRLANPDDSKGNGDRACPRGDSYPRPVGYECDEYPFRSTQEGAKTSGTPFAPRTFSFCPLTDQWPQTPVVNTDIGSQGWARCNIPGDHNNAGGQALKAFYLNERVLPSDQFYVVVS
ncbi:hypothetical protein [Streptomyces sp. NPDC005877]|uniref:NucA/NucB deoxyribonuclease domain-containing protein n=1 Tax=Streptomyces sp. NPDC005877 TaxID=3155346 RepID=UPI0033DB5F13